MDNGIDRAIRGIEHAVNWLAAAALPFLWHIQGWDTLVLSSELKLWGVWIDYILLAVPLFVFLGELIGRSNIGPNLYQFPHQAALDALAAMAGWDRRDTLPLLNMPTLVVWGDSDRPYRWPQVASLWTNIPNVRLSVVPGTAHAVHLEKPGIFQSLIFDFLNEDGAGRYCGGIVTRSGVHPIPVPQPFSDA